MMVCHQVVATLDVVISDLRRDKVIDEMLPWFVLVQLGGPGSLWAGGQLPGEDDGFRRDLSWQEQEK